MVEYVRHSMKLINHLDKKWTILFIIVLLRSSETLNSDLSCTQEGSLHGQLATIMETPGSEVTADDQCVGEEKYVTEMETNKIARKEMNNADWMKLALVLDKVFLACAIVAMVGTLSYCFFKFQL